MHQELKAPCFGSELLMAGSARLAVLILAYLNQSDEYPVEVAPTNRPSGPKRGERHPKPWLRDDLSHVILIDPQRVHEYRARTAVEEQGHHASPYPHQRRGHWRQLRAERFHEKRRLWVRQAWIGDTEWMFEGQTYRVLQPRASQ